MTVCLNKLFSLLLEAYGPQAWWPADTPFEVMVGAVLVQNTAWKNVRRAIDQLRDAGRLSPQAIHASPQQELETLIRPAGYYRFGIQTRYPAGKDFSQQLQQVFLFIQSTPFPFRSLPGTRFRIAWEAPFCLQNT